MSITLSLILLLLVLLYVAKTLYDVNLGKSKEGRKKAVHVLEKTHKKLLSTPVEQPPSVIPKDSLQQAEHYDIGEEEASDTILDAPPPLVVKELIPETEYIDLDCFSYFKGAKLLVVEDNMLNQKIITNVLKQSGIEIDLAENGQVALDLLFKKHKAYDMVLMDISMPIMDGITTTRIIRRASRYNHLPIVTFTAFSLGPEIEAMFEAGANAYLVKPLNIKQLYTVFTLFMGNVNRGLSLKQMLEIQGLDIEKGLENVDGDLSIYQKILEEFMYRYHGSIDLVPKWIEEKRYDRVRLECKEMLPFLSHIGAYDMHDMVQDMQRQFTYRNEHLLDKFKLLYRTKMQALQDTIHVYLDSLKKK
jgi:CheY-like chemotaxis protein